MISLKMDDRTVEVEEGATLLQAAEKLGIQIPTLCHHRSGGHARVSRPPVSTRRKRAWSSRPRPSAS